MDTTLKYIKMCEEAKEIQDLAPKIRTRIHTKMNICICSDDKFGLGGVYYCMDTVSDDGITVESTYAVWLPRQDQLQEILNKTTYFILMDFTNFVDSKWGYESCVVNKYSMEQLWLAFVMKEKFNKHWDNNIWTK